VTSLFRVARPRRAPVILAFLATFPVVGCASNGAQASCPELAGASTAPATAQLAAAEDVPMPRGNAALTGEMTGRGPSGAAPTLIWRFDTAGPASDPVIVDDIVYTNVKNDRLYALDAFTGQELWSADTGGGSPPVVTDRTLFVLESDGYLYASDVGTGKLRWSFPVGAHNMPPGFTVARGMVFATSGGSLVYAIDVASGTERWRFELPDIGDANSSSASATIGAPVVLANVVHVRADIGSLYAIGADSGKRCWRGATETLGAWFANDPVASDGLIYVSDQTGGPNNDRLYALDAQTGERRWRFKPAGGSSTPAVVGGVVYVGSDTRSLYAIGARSGEKKWSFETGDFSLAQPVAADGVIYAASRDGFIYAIDAGTGTQRWRFEIGKSSSTSPAVSRGIVYVGADDGLYAISAH
jgi:outer membrane protein assembly factor BamB